MSSSDQNVISPLNAMSQSGGAPYHNVRRGLGQHEVTHEMEIRLYRDFDDTSWSYEL